MYGKLEWIKKPVPVQTGISRFIEGLNEPTVMNDCIMVKSKYMDQKETFIQMAIKAWDIQIGRTDKFFNGLNEETFLKEIAPGKNRIVYLLGHLIAVNDGMHALFGMSERSYT